MTRAVALALIAVTLSGCATGAYWTAVGVEAGKQAKDAEAEALSNAACAIGVGALARMEYAKRRAIMDLCGVTGWRY